jgi:hypothetical protein
MGIKVTNGGPGRQFFKINAKEGCFQTGSGADKQKFEPGRAAIIGLLIGFAIKPETYETQHSEVVQLLMKDPEGGPNMQVDFTVATGGDGSDVQGDATSFGLRLLGKLNAADLSKPIEIKPWFVKQGETIGDTKYENDTASCSVKQDGQSLRCDFGNGVIELPTLPKIKVGNKDVADKSPWNALLDATLDSLHTKLPKPTNGHAQAAGAADEQVDLADAAAAASAAPAAANREGMRSRA